MGLWVRPAQTSARTPRAARTAKAKREEGAISSPRSLSPARHRPGTRRRGQSPRTSPDSPLGLPRLSHAPGRSARTSPARGRCLGRLGEGSHRLLRDRRPALPPGTSIGPSRYSPRTARRAQTRGPAPGCGARSRALRGCSGRRLRVPPPGPPADGRSRGGAGGDGPHRRGRGRRGGAKSVPAPPPPPSWGDFVLGGTRQGCLMGQQRPRVRVHF